MINRLKSHRSLNNVLKIIFLHLSEKSLLLLLFYFFIFYINVFFIILSRQFFLMLSVLRLQPLVRPLVARKDKFSSISPENLSPSLPQTCHVVSLYHNWYRYRFCHVRIYCIWIEVTCTLIISSQTVFWYNTSREFSNDGSSLRGCCWIHLNFFLSVLFLSLVSALVPSHRQYF